MLGPHRQEELRPDVLQLDDGAVLERFAIYLEANFLVVRGLARAVIIVIGNND